MRVDDGGADDVAFVISTGTSYGPITVEAWYGEHDPGVGDEWEDIVELSASTSTGLDLNELVDGRVATLVDRPGQFRVRVSCRGRTESAAAGERYGRTALEKYLIEVWPSQQREPASLRLTSDFATSAVDGPPEPLPVAERVDGLAGSTAIGRDLDRGPGARTLSGQLAEIRIQRTIPGTRRRVWARTAVGPHFTAPSTQNGVFYQVSEGSVFCLWSHRSLDEDGDGITGTTAGIKLVFIAANSPRRQVKSWNWFQQVPGKYLHEDGATVPFLESDSTVTLDFHEEKTGDGERRTTITVTHSGVPEEWADDLAAWWRWNLAEAQEQAIGLP